MSGRSRGRSLVLVVVLEIALRHALGLFGIAFPSRGPEIQYSLIVWGLVAVIWCIVLLHREHAKQVLPVVAGLTFLAAGVVARLPLDQPLGELLTTALTVWARLALPVVATALFLLNLSVFLEYFESVLRRPRVLPGILIIAALSAAFLAYRLAGGLAWSWSPQQPAPYLLIVGLGSVGLLTAGRLAVLLGLGVLSLKRTAALGLLAMLSTSPRPSLPEPRRLVGAAALLGLLILVMPAVTGTTLADVVANRVAAGVEQFRQPADARARGAVTSLGARTLENRHAIAQWTDSPATIVLGGRLERQEVGNRQILTVHNTFISALHLGGILYLLVFTVVVSSVAGASERKLPRTSFRWYFAGAIGMAVESLGGNALLTVTFGFALAVLLSWRNGRATEVGGKIAPRRGGLTRGGSEVRTV